MIIKVLCERSHPTFTPSSEFCPSSFPGTASHHWTGSEELRWSGGGAPPPLWEGPAQGQCLQGQIPEHPLQGRRLYEADNFLE